MNIDPTNTWVRLLLGNKYFIIDGCGLVRRIVLRGCVGFVMLCLPIMVAFGIFTMMWVGDGAIDEFISGLFPNSTLLQWLSYMSVAITFLGGVALVTAIGMYLVIKGIECYINHVHPLWGKLIFSIVKKQKTSTWSSAISLFIDSAVALVKKACPVVTYNIGIFHNIKIGDIMMVSYDGRAATAMRFAGRVKFDTDDRGRQYIQFRTQYNNENASGTELFLYYPDDKTFKDVFSSTPVTLYKPSCSGH